MAEIDPVILELRAELGRYRADLAATATMAERNFARQDRAVRNLEKQMMRSSTAISGALRGLAGTLATAFTGRELVNLLDGYTRLQNALRVAGRIDLGAWQTGGERYISFLRGRGDVAQYFKLFLGCNDL